MRRRVLEGRLERRVADQQLRVGVLAERDLLGLGQQHLGKHDGRRRLRRDRDDAHLLERLARHELDRIDRALTRHAETRQQAQLVGVACVLDRRDRRRIELAVDEHPVQLRRHALDFLHVHFDAVEDRRHVHVADAAELDHRRCQNVTRLPSGSRIPNSRVPHG